MSGYYGPTVGNFVRRFPYVTWGVGLVLSGLISLQALAMVNAQSGSGFLIAQFRTERPENLADRAQRMISRDQAEQAAGLARRAIRRSPVYQPGVRAYGLAVIAAGDVDKGTEIMAAAGKLGWRDGPTQSWLMQEDFKRERFKAGYQRAEALVSRVGMTPEIFALFALFPAEPLLNREFMAQLVTNPEWRSEFFQNARTATPQQIQSLATVIEALSATEAPPTREEAIEVVAGLINAGDVTRARDLDRRFVGKSTAAAGTGINDGGFDQLDHYRDPDYRPSPFEWRLGFGRGVSSVIEDKGGGNGALFVTADGATQQPLASQWLNLSPGDYILRAKVGGNVAKSEERFRFSLSCVTTVEKSAVPLTERAGDTTHMEVEFTISEDSCPSQILVLIAMRLSTRKTASEWFDDFTITRR